LGFCLGVPSPKGNCFPLLVCMLLIEYFKWGKLRFDAGLQSFTTSMLSSILGITKEIMSRGPQVLDMECREPDDLSMALEGPSFLQYNRLSTTTTSIPPAWS
jgi:hypothetical protein